MIDLHINSPVEEIKLALLEELQVKLFIKRDDLIHPFISGNKWRKLKHHLIKAKQEEKDHLITFGGAWSNHLLATACAAAKFGFKSTGFVRGENVSNEVLLLCRLFGMQLFFTDRESYRDKLSLYQQRFGDNNNTYFINEGGAGKEAAAGCAELIGELSCRYDHIFVAAGTGTTAAGLIKGIEQHRLTTHVHVVPALKGDFIRAEINQLVSEDSLYTVHAGYHFGGYAKTQPELLEFISWFSASTGILTDPVYTGKTLFAAIDLIRKHTFPPGSRILIIHTGGLFGLLGMKEKFSF